MVQFLSINFFSWISSIFVGFLNVPFFCVTLYNAPVFSFFFFNMAGLSGNIYCGGAA